MGLIGLGLGLLSSIAVGCEYEEDNPFVGCNCHPARTGTTTLGEPTSDDGDFPDLEGAWLNILSTEVARYNPETPAAILEYFDTGELVRVKFVAVLPDVGNGGAGGSGTTR